MTLTTTHHQLGPYNHWIYYSFLLRAQSIPERGQGELNQAGICMERRQNQIADSLN